MEEGLGSLDSAVSEESDIMEFDAIPDDRTLVIQTNAATISGDVSVNNMIFSENVHINLPRQQLTLEGDNAPRFVAEFKNGCLEKTRRHTKEKVAQFQLKEPKDLVYPEIIDTNYYSGEAAGPECYKPDPTFTVHKQRNIQGDKIQWDEIHDECNYAAIIAEAGAGKTTLAKRYARAVMEKKVPSMRHIELVHYVNFARIDPGKEHTVFKLLFLEQLWSIRMSSEAEKYGNLWVKENGSKILLVLDGLDQATWILDKKVHCRTMSYNTKAKAPVLVYNILHNNLLGECKILVTSREHAIIHFDRESRPQKIFALNGLSQKNISLLIQQLAPEKGLEIIQHIAQKSPGLRSLCVNPMFLIFTVAVLSRNLEDAPDTLSGVLLRVLWYFFNSENQRVEKDVIRDALRNLMHLAFDGTERKSVLFTEEELRSHDLTPEQVHDFVIMSPERDTERHFKLMEGSFRLFFCHQSVQEALSAMEASKKTPQDFEVFVKDCLSKPHWEVVLRILLGITMNGKTADDASRLSGMRVNRECKHMLEAWLENAVIRNQHMAVAGSKRRHSDDNIPHFRTEDLCMLLYECGDGVSGIIGRLVHTVRIKKRLRADQAYAVAWVLSRCNEVTDLELNTGAVGPSADLLARGLKACKSIQFKSTKWNLTVKNQILVGNGCGNRIEDVQIEVNDKQEEPVSVLANMLAGTQVTKLKVEVRNKDNEPFLTEDQMKLLREINAKVGTLDLSRPHCAKMTNTEQSTFSVIGDVVQNLKVDKLDLSNFELNAGEKQALYAGLGEHEVEVVTMSGTFSNAKNPVLKEKNFNEELGADIIQNGMQRLKNSL